MVSLRQKSHEATDIPIQGDKIGDQELRAFVPFREIQAPASVGRDVA